MRWSSAERPAPSSSPARGSTPRCASSTAPAPHRRPPTAVNIRRMLTETDPGTAPGMGADDRAGVSVRSMALGLAVGVPVSLVLLYVATRGVAWEDVRAALRDARLGPLAAAVVALGGVYVIQGARWRWIARRQARSSQATFVGLVVAG